MKHIFRLTIILAISLLGELLNALIPLPIPGSIYGLVLMLAGLCTGIIPLEKVESTGRFLIEIMPVMFIPAAAGLIDSWSAVRPMLVPALVIMVVSTFIVMGVTGYVTQALMRRSRKEEGDAE
ncbi:MAG: CidA/LrgA family protein [Clostridia bacterium]|nr:CidA/LrgA family protein [Clostridia bacterium]MBP3652532.1 CidA/LrgA family protein [Clostridia bacterium]